MNSNTSAIGVKGSEDLGDGMKAIYKVEFQIDPTVTTTTISSRDQFVGLKGGMGTVKFGTMSSNYNTRPRAAEIMVDGDQVFVIRERETIAEQFASEKLLPK